ncbi:MAG: type II toxin-antitoxin system VapB family antitoxin [Geminicoccaceae bacterium]
MAALNIRDPEVHELARQLAARTGTSITEAVKQALRDGLRQAGSRSQRDLATRRKRVAEILERYRSLPVLDERSADEILGYNERGHFD